MRVMLSITQVAVEGLGRSRGEDADMMLFKKGSSQLISASS